MLKKLENTREGICGMSMIQGKGDQQSGTEYIRAIEQLSWLVLPQDTPLLRLAWASAKEPVLLPNSAEVTVM